MVFVVKVLNDENQFRRPLIDQVVQTALAETQVKLEMFIFGQDLKLNPSLGSLKA